MQRLKSPSNVNSVTPSFQFNVPIANRFECLTSQTNFIQLWLFTAYDNKTVVNHFSINDATETHRTTNAMAFHRIVSISVFELLFVLSSVSWFKKLSWTGFEIDIDIIISLRCLVPLLFIKAVRKTWYCFWGWDNFQVNLIEFFFKIRAHWQKSYLVDWWPLIFSEDHIDSKIIFISH